MAVIYVRSTDGLDTDNGSTWALAKATIAGALAIAVAGDRIWVSQAHAEVASSVTLTGPATSGAPVEIFCGNDGSQPPTARTTGASVANNTAGQNIALAGNLVFYGINFNAGSGATSGSACNVQAVGTSFRMRFENCLLSCRNTNTGARLAFGTSGTGGDELVQFVNCTFLFNAVAQGFSIGCPAEFINCSFNPSTLAMTSIFKTSQADTFDITMVGCDFTTGTDGSTALLSNANCKGGTITIRDCKSASFWPVPSPLSTGPGQPKIVYDNVDGTVKHFRYAFEGETRREGTLIKSGGASDGAAGYSVRMLSSANARIHNPLYTREGLIWNTTTGSSKNIAIDILHDNVTGLLDSEIWIEVQYLANSGDNRSGFASDRVADTVTAGSTQASSSATWTTTGMANPNKQKLDVDITPQQIGWIRVRVALAKASYPVYIDPKIIVT